ncbi:hypothetical protein ACWGLE_24095 [Streptomyces sp. NPDC055897]
MADAMEADQLDRAFDLAAHGLKLISSEDTEPLTLERLAAALAEALQTTLRVATSRGHRLALPERPDRLHGLLGRLD